MAGNIALSLNDGVLTLLGDGQANEVFIGAIGNGTYAVRGLVGTTVNGNESGLVWAGQPPTRDGRTWVTT